MEKQQELILSKDREIIEFWAGIEIQGTSLFERPFYHSLNNQMIEVKATGKFYVKKSQYAIVNWWRKLTGTERMEAEYVYTWILPKIK